MSKLSRADSEKLFSLLLSYKRTIIRATLPESATICAVDGMERIVDREPSFIHVDIAVRQFINSVSEDK